MKESGEAAGSIVGWGEGRLQEMVWGQWTAFGKLGKEEEEEQEECFPKCKPFSYSLTPDSCLMLIICIKVSWAVCIMLGCLQKWIKSV